MATGDVEPERVTTSEGVHWRLVLHGKYATQAEAWAEANRVGRLLRRESFLRGLSGRWRKRNTHGHDPERHVG